MSILVIHQQSIWWHGKDSEGGSGTDSGYYVKQILIYHGHEETKITMPSKI